jgi:hypothetical protein
MTAHVLSCDTLDQLPYSALVLALLADAGGTLSLWGVNMASGEPFLNNGCA